MKTQVLHVEHGHAARRQDIGGDLRQRGRVRAGEDATANPGIQRARRITSDEVQKTAAAVATEGPSQDVAQLVEPAPPNVFQHTDGDERIEMAFRRSVIVLDERHTTGQTRPCRSLACIDHLLVRDVERGHGDAVLPVPCEAPALPSRFPPRARTLQV